MTEPPHLRVVVQREIQASLDTVWSILTTPTLFSEWMDGEVAFDPVEGSAFRAAFPRFDTVISGEVCAVDHDAHRLELSWGVESGAQADSFPAGSSRVVFALHETGSGCRIDLRHESLPSGDEARDHEQGWNFHLSRMDLIANRRDLGEALPDVLEAWFAAWNETDPERRADLLEACCVGDVVFRDDWTSLSGRRLLNMHIGNCQRFVPGYTLAPVGDTRICRGEALVGWSSGGPDGEQHGHNHMRVDPTGKIVSVTGFGRT